MQCCGLRPWSYDKTGLRPVPVLVLYIWSWSWSWSENIGLVSNTATMMITMISNVCRRLWYWALGHLLEQQCHLANKDEGTHSRNLTVQELLRK